MGVDRIGFASHQPRERVRVNIVGAAWHIFNLVFHPPVIIEYTAFCKSQMSWAF